MTTLGQQTSIVTVLPQNVINSADFNMRGYQFNTEI